MSKFFEFNSIKSEENPNHIEGCNFYTAEGLPYGHTIFFRIGFDEKNDNPIFFVNTEEFNLPELIQKEGCKIFWAGKSLVFRFGDKFYASPQLPEQFFNQITKNGSFKLRFPIDNKISNDYEIQEESLCQ